MSKRGDAGARPGEVEARPASSASGSGTRIVRRAEAGEIGGDRRRLHAVAGAGCAATGCRGAWTVCRRRRRPAAADGRSARRRGSRAERREQVDLHAGVGDVVLAADDVGDAGVDVVHHRGEGVERRAVGADQHRVGHARAASPARWPSTRSFQVDACASDSRKRQYGRLPPASAAARCSGGQLQHGAVVDRRLARRLSAARAWRSVPPPISKQG